MGTAVLTGRDMSVLTIEFGGPVDGSASFGSPINGKCYCESYERDVQIDGIDVTARCDTQKAELPAAAGLNLRLVLTVPPAGCLAPAANQGEYIRVTMTEKASGETFVDIGYFKGNKLTSPKADKLTQEITVAPTI